MLKAVKFGPDDVKEDLTEHDTKAIKEVLTRKAAAFWLETTPRTTVRYMMHDTIQYTYNICIFHTLYYNNIL